MRLASVIPMLLLLLAACGGEENNAASNGAVPVVHIANTIQATKTGSVTIDAFDVATGELRGSIDVTLTDMGGITYTAAGTFDASLGLCGDTTLLQCQGKP